MCGWMNEWMGSIVSGKKSTCAQWNWKVSALQLALSSSHTWRAWAVERVRVTKTGDRGPWLRTKDEPFILQAVQVLIAILVEPWKDRGQALEKLNQEGASPWRPQVCLVLGTQPRFHSGLCHLWTKEPWGRHLPSLGLSFLACNGMIVSPSQGGCERAPFPNMSQNLMYPTTLLNSFLKEKKTLM